MRETPPPRIVAAASAEPPHAIDREATKAWCRALYAGRRELPSLLRVIDRAGVERRGLALPPERIVKPRSFAERNAEFAECAVELGEAAARRALDRAGLDASAIDLIVTTSCTGILIPSLAAYLAPRLGLRADVVRLPITELGCAAGAAALARAADHLRAHPDRAALVLAVELPSLTFQIDDLSMANFVSAAIFGDGAAAAVLRGAERARAAIDEKGGEGIDLVRSASHLFPDTRRFMGFDLGEGGFRIVLAREVPDYLLGRVRPLVDALCAAQGVARASLAFAVLHPGGARILDNLGRDLDLPRPLLDPARTVLARHGNMSSATVLHVLERVLASRPPPPPGSFGLLAAFGPGFAAELSLLRWNP